MPQVTPFGIADCGHTKSREADALKPIYRQVLERLLRPT